MIFSKTHGIIQRLYRFLKLYFNSLQYQLKRSLPHSFIDKSLEIRDFKSKNLITQVENNPKPLSHYRVLSILFLKNLPWKDFKSELGNIQIFDTGCGSGDYGLKLKKFSNNNISSYTGIDIHKNKN